MYIEVEYIKGEKPKVLKEYKNLDQVSKEHSLDLKIIPFLKKFGTYRFPGTDIWVEKK